MTSRAEKHTKLIENATKPDLGVDFLEKLINTAQQSLEKAKKNELDIYTPDTLPDTTIGTNFHDIAEAESLQNPRGDRLGGPTRAADSAETRRVLGRLGPQTSTAWGPTRPRTRAPTRRTNWPYRQEFREFVTKYGLWQ